ncbi:diaminopimelate epimerase [Domibacillus epiphyticus]|uniref:Diaminopimelate epimerase n=1 Tax=Domibacillus epiphyticus TaxID=1714355 RepID=A0A1V2A543_9BACI|nr:diaminopimelate epimerase [Domibacillus epiphyticus]OMP66096.1 diaminopimelate epimerase [Domibacillus epiphyticus]
MELSFIKGHGSGNDFLLIDEWTHGYTFTEENRHDLALALCSRETGIGADGIVFVMESQHADAKMRIFNSDGSEASMCGNGLRLHGRYVLDKLERDEIVVETNKADLYVKRDGDIYEGVPAYRVEISPVLFDLESLPMTIGKDRLFNEIVPELSDSIPFTAVAVPNPHLIAVGDRALIASGEQKRISEMLNSPNAICPDGVNVSFVHPIEKGVIYVRTFERGVGFTNACGTAMSASTLTTCQLGLNEIEVPVEVYNNGGKVRCEVHKHEQDRYSIDLIGNGTYMFEAVVQLELDSPIDFQLKGRKEFAEQTAYEKLREEVVSYLNEHVL